MSIKKEIFAKTPDGREVYLFILTNTNGLKAEIINYGAILASLQTPDKNGDFADITLGLDSLAEYIENNTAYFGAIIGC